jgi:prepilin-type N-terminal cleavage/methylation domain-containing protein
MKNKQGMTLIELIIAMAIFGMIMVSIFPAFIILNLTNIVSEENVSANYLAQHTSEELYQLGRDDTVTQANFATHLATLGFTLDGSGQYLNNSHVDYQQWLTVTHDDPEVGFTRLILVVDSKHNYVFDTNSINDYRSQIETIIVLGN